MARAASTPASEISPTLRLLTCNLQVGIHTSAYHHYVTRSWQHLLPHPKRSSRLDAVASTLAGFDIVGLQEVDGGSFRSNHVNQVEYLARRSAFGFHFQQLNRDMGKMAQHSNGLLSRLTPSQIDEHRLPGMRGRGAIHARYGEGPDALHVFVAHLALSQRGRARQLDYLSEIIAPLNHVVVMGDLNATPEQLLSHPHFFKALDFNPLKPLLSYPAWQPRRALDHILLSSTLEAGEPRVLDAMFSDHLPVAVNIHLPAACRLSLGLTGARTD
ncbi:endonuclease/exonuclease/phosphatase family protein [Salinicola rhizosphaerae]|uniref:Endonuclease n=1 Tax=Salinicola rhizosphaerae TaxID=1443141 RepID=A0ABQ3DTR2_9GAMM|nr:endonuclease/exonuclease/phosphatase family protein [Salinicola rhizosphaerae]GHB12376.1 endonuclease [Salinicola rhizosphaerae]